MQDGHRTHDARFIGEVDVQVDAEVATRGDVILLVVLLLDVGQRTVAEERAVQQGRVSASSAKSLLGNHGNGTLNGMRHNIASARMLLRGPRR